MKAYIVYHKYFNFESGEVYIGGVQTYITELSKILIGIGYECVVIQSSSEEFDIFRGNIRIVGVKIKTRFLYRLRHHLNRKLKQFVNPREDLIIFGSDHFTSKHNSPTISIQHGVDWDLPNKYMNRFAGRSRILARIQKYTKKRISISSLNNATHTVCVDYNFINTYRGESIDTLNSYTVIPNFADTQKVVTRSSSDVVKILFARRMERYRGTDIFVGAVKNLLPRFKNVHVTIAGDGPELHRIKEDLREYSNVFFTIYSSSSSLQIHSQHDIAVIASHGCEGSSLSAIEAMAAGCAVIATNVGGITNIIIDGYNGVLINPQQEALERAIEGLIFNAEELNRLKLVSRNVAETALSKDVWASKWVKLIDLVSRNKLK